MFSILGILLSAQQTAVLDLLGPPRVYTNSRSAKADIRRYLPLMLTEVRKLGYESESQPEVSGVGFWEPRWKMVFTWQCPIMFMSYSVCLFLLGLTMFVCTPLIRGDEWSPASNVSARDLLFTVRIQRADAPGDRGYIFRGSGNRRSSVCVLFILGVSLCRPRTRGR